MDPKAAVTAIERSPEFRDFTKARPEFFLVHAFAMYAVGERPEWHLGYYSKKSDTIVSFLAEPVRQEEEQEVFKESGALQRLDLAAVTLSPAQALAIADGIVAKHYAGEETTKVIVMLQHLEQQVYNITFVTKQLNLVNIRVDAATGEVRQHLRRSVLSLRAE